MMHPLIRQFDLPDPVKYDNRTWEYVVYEGNQGSAVSLGQ